MTKKEINFILYSAIRNDTHLAIRNKGYIHQTFRLVYIILFKKKVKGNYNHKSATVINDAPSNIPLNFKKINLNELVLSYTNPHSKKLFFIEIFLNLAFLIRIRWIQKILIDISQRLTKSFLNKNNIKALVCGHPTILMTFIGYQLKKERGYVITAQHGIYSLGDYKVLWFEKEIATHVLVYGKYFKELYEKQGTPKNNLIIGSPYFTSTWEASEKKEATITFKNNKVLFLGQQLYKMSNVVFEPYNEFISQLISFYQNKNIDVYYRPHPRESLTDSLTKENLASLVIDQDKEKIDEFDIYYSVNSSLLLELYLQKKICFQVNIQISDINYDHFYPYTGIPLVAVENIENHLSLANYIFKYDKDYINLQDHNSMSLAIEEILSHIQDTPQS